MNTYRKADMTRDNKRLSRLDYLDTRVLHILNSVLAKNVVLAGGALQTMFNPDIEVNDYDLFFLEDEKNSTFTEDVAWVEEMLEYYKFECVFRCPRGDLTTWKSGNTKVQLITKFRYSGVMQLIYSFDFRCAMIALNQLELHFMMGSVKDTIKKRLTIMDVTFPVATLNRIMKYKYNKGFEVNAQAMMDYVYFINEMELDDDNMVLYVD